MVFKTEVNNTTSRTTIHNRRFYTTQLIHLDGNSLTLEVIAVARHGAHSELDEQAKEAAIASRKIADDIVREKRVVYGVTTRLWFLCNVKVSSLQKILFYCKKT